MSKIHTTQWTSRMLRYSCNGKSPLALYGQKYFQVNQLWLFGKIQFSIIVTVNKRSKYNFSIIFLQWSVNAKEFDELLNFNIFYKMTRKTSLSLYENRCKSYNSWFFNFLLLHEKKWSFEYHSNQLKYFLNLHVQDSRFISCVAFIPTPTFVAALKEPCSVVRLLKLSASFLLE